MKRIVKLWVTAGKLTERMPNWLEMAREVVQPLAPMNEIVLPAGVDFIFDRHHEALEEVQQRLRGYGFYTAITERREYTLQERLSAKFLEVGIEGVAYSVARKQAGKWERTLRWDWELHCPHCGFWVERWDLKALRIKTAPTGYRLAWVDHSGPCVVSAPLAKALQEGGFRGLELVPLEGREPPGWYVFRATHLLPPMAVPPTRMTRDESVTPQCAPDHGWSNPVSELFYRRAGWEAQDFNYTYEIFGRVVRSPDGTIFGSTGRTLIVSNRVYRLLRELKVRQLVWEPIQFVE